MHKPSLNYSIRVLHNFFTCRWYPYQIINGGIKMRKVLKWVLYILLGLVALSVVAGVVVMVFGGLRYGMMGPSVRVYEPGFRMMEHGRYYFHSGLPIFGGLLCLGVIVLVIVGIVALVNALVHRNKPAQIAPPAQVVTEPAQPAISTEEVSAPTHTCANCGKPTQADWKTCPYCGNPLVE
jgi:zinc-ribbon domain